jgi:hypothetical protein
MGLLSLCGRKPNVNFLKKYITPNCKYEHKLRKPSTKSELLLGAKLQCALEPILSSPCWISNFRRKVVKECCTMPVCLGKIFAAHPLLLAVDTKHALVKEFSCTSTSFQSNDLR